jgi:DNA-binding MarR family transcriptional regulator
MLSARRTMTAGELAQATARDQSNLTKELERMVGAGLIARVPVPHDPAAPKSPGRPAESAYELPDEQREALERALGSRLRPGMLRAAQQLVFAEATAEQIDDLHHVLADAATAVGAAWGAICDGERQEYLIVLDGPRAATAATDLMGQLAAAQVRCRRATVAQLLSAGELQDRARAATLAAQRVRLRRSTRRAAHGA